MDVIIPEVMKFVVSFIPLFWPQIFQQVLKKQIHINKNALVAGPGRRPEWEGSSGLAKASGFPSGRRI